MIKPEFCSGLLDSGDAWAATSFVWEGLTFRRGDIIFVKDVPMLLVAGVVAENGCFSMIGHSMAFVRKVTDSASAWQRGALANYEIDPLCVRLPAAWHSEGTDYVVLSF